MRTLKIIFALLLFACLIDLPYGYYQLVRLIGLFFFGYLAYENYKNENPTKAIIFLMLAILFQPLIKISLGRTLWNIVDLIVGVGLLIDAFSYKQK